MDGTNMSFNYSTQSTAENRGLKDRLIEGLAKIPQSWALTPLGGNKIPYRTGWQKESPLTHDQIIADIKGGKSKGYGIRTGEISGGVLAIDLDGDSAHAKALALSGGVPLPDTISFTSGRHGREQRLYLVPQEYWGVIATKKIESGKDPEGNPEHLELRWNGCQSCLPPSLHPTTSGYRWINSPQDIALAPVPMWVIEQMLGASTPTRRQPSRTLSFDPVPLLQCLSKSDRDLIDRGAAQGSRNDDGAKLARNLIGTAQRLGYLGIEYSDSPRQLFSDYCDRCNPPIPDREADLIWRSAEKSNPTASLTDVALENCVKAWQKKQPNIGAKNTNISYYQNPGCTGKQKSSVTGDSRSGGDTYNQYTLDITATVTSVTEILQNGFLDYVESQKLEEIRSISALNNQGAFYQLVSALRSQFDDIHPDDKVRLDSLIKWHNSDLDFRKALPTMAEDILHDAKILNIDPVGIWQYLLPAVLSLAGKKTTLDVDSHTVPAIAWTGLLAESGMGKTRAEKLVTAPLKQLQKQARERFKAEVDDWQETCENWEKGSGKKPPKPVERKYLFDVATIQAVMRRQSEQGSNGSLWARDELVGIFQSFSQFSNGESEALSCLLAGWDGGSSQVDRVNQEDSYFVDETRLSIAGGIQPDIFKKIFKDPKDSQGLQARFLFAKMKTMKPKRIKGFCRLTEKLPPLYYWLDSLPEGTVKLSPQADSYYTKLYDAIGDQTLNTSMPAIRAWMAKLPGQLLRIALGLHLIECYADRDRSVWILQKDTLERAVLFAQYYRSAFHVIQTTAVETDDISSILLQIWDKAITRHPDGISTRDAYREIKAIQYRAKDAGRAVSAYAADLFNQLESMGKGKVIKSGRLIKFVANLNPLAISLSNDDRPAQEFQGSGDTVTVAETPVTPMVSTVTEIEVSPVTVSVDTCSITQERCRDVAQELEAPAPAPTPEERLIELKVGARVEIDTPASETSSQGRYHGLSGTISGFNSEGDQVYVEVHFENGEAGDFLPKYHFNSG